MKKAKPKAKPKKTAKKKVQNKAVKKTAKKSKPAPKKQIVKKAVEIKKPVKKVVEVKKVPEPEKKPQRKYNPNEFFHVYLALGSNVGDREEYIEQAITLLRETQGIKVMRRASNYETEAQGRKNQAAFINSVVAINTNIAPDKLLAVTQSIEDTLGRERGVEWGPRTIDIDILLYGSEVISEDNLIIPHALMHERMFVLEPLKQIAPYTKHPVLDRTITELFNDKKEESSDGYDDELSGYKEVKRGISDDYERW